jgi:hypothetical protein
MITPPNARGLWSHGVSRFFWLWMWAWTGTLERLGFWRSLLGLATTVFVSIDTRPVSDVVVDDAGTNVLRNALLGLLAVPVSMLAVYFLTQRQYRAELGFRRVIGRLALFLTTVLLPVVLITEFLIGKDLPFENATEVNVVNVVGVLLLLGLLLWWPVYMLCGIYWAGRTYCWIGEFHPLLAPSVTAGMTTVLAVIGLVEMDTNGLAPEVWLTLTLGGVVTTLILATAEYVQLVRAGIGWRTGPNPAQAVEAY